MSYSNSLVAKFRKVSEEQLFILWADFTFINIVENSIQNFNINTRAEMLRKYEPTYQEKKCHFSDQFELERVNEN